MSFSRAFCYSLILHVAVFCIVIIGAAGDAMPMLRLPQVVTPNISLPDIASVTTLFTALPTAIRWGLPALLALSAIMLLGWRQAGRVRQPSLFVARPILNGSEAKLYRQIETRLPKGLRLMAQVSYGEILRCRDRKRFLTISARRADLVIVDASFNVVAVIEYQGHGHYGDSKDDFDRATLSDRRKQTALDEAGIALLRIPANCTIANLERALQPIIPPQGVRL